MNIMILINLLILTLKTSADLSILIITSSQTPINERILIESNIEALIYQISTKFGFTEPVKLLYSSIDLNSNNDYWADLRSFPSGIFLDFVHNPSLSNQLSYFAFEQNILHLIMGLNTNFDYFESLSPNTLSSDLSLELEAKILYSIVQNFNWTHLALIHDDLENHSRTGDYIKKYIQVPKILETELSFTNIDDYATISARLSSSIKKTKGKVIFLITSSQLAVKIIRAAENAGMAGSGYIWLLGSSAIMNFGETLKNTYKTFNTNIMKSGVLGIAPQSQSDLQNDPVSIWTSMLAVTFKSIQQVGSFEGSDLASLLRGGVSIQGPYLSLHFDDLGMRNEDYDLINIQEFYPKKVGIWSENKLKIDSKDKFIWPGYTETVPSDEFVSLYLVLLHPGPDNYEDTGIVNSFNLAIETINSDNSYLPGFVLNPILIVPYSASQVIPGSLNFLDNVNVVGFIGPWGNELAKSYADYISTLEHPKPLVSYQAASYILNSSYEFPYFLRTAQSDGSTAPALIAFLELMKWKKIAVVYTDDDTGVGVYNSFIENIKSYDIKIKNQESKRKIVLNYKNEKLSSTTLDSIDEVLSEIIRKQLKIILFFGNEDLTTQLVKDIHRKELYGKDYFWLGSGWLNTKLIEDLKNSSYLQTLQGFMSLAPRPAIGEPGQAFAAAYKSRFSESPSAYAALAYDSVFMYADCLTRMIEAGEDFNRLETLMSFLRTSDFDAASGTLKFTEGFNDRYMTGFSLLNVQEQDLVLIMQYDPLTSYVAEGKTSIKWPGGASAPSDSWSGTYDCPFPKSMSVSSETGIITIIMIGIGLVIVSFSISVFHHNRTRKIIFEKLKVKEFKTWKDTMVEIMIVVEFLQFLAIAPSFKSLELLIKILSNVFMLDVIKITDASTSYYWFMLSAVCSLCFVWFSFMIVMIFKKSGVINRVPLCKRFFGSLISFFLPFFGNTLFLPTLAFLLDAFVCDHQVLGYAYVWRDCYQTCWTHEHVKYIVLSSFAIVLYQPLAIICRPLWQEAHKDVHLKTKTTFLLIKTCFQILLITVGKALQGNFPLAHGILFTLLSCIFTGTTYKYRAFNYDRCDLWELVSLASLTFYSVLATLSFIGDENNFGWVIGLIFGWLLIVAVGYGVQYKYYPPLLFTEERQKQSGKICDLEEKVPSIANHDN